MLKLFCVFICGVSLFAQAPVGSATNYFAATLTAAGPTASIYAGTQNHTLQINVLVSDTVCTVRLEGSIDNANWSDLSGSQPCTSATSMFHVDGKYLPYLRANLLTYTGNAAGVTIYYAGTK
jgi:hypothetical protein